MMVENRQLFLTESQLINVEGMSPVWCGSVRHIIPQSETSQFGFPIRAHAGVAGPVPSWGACRRQPINVSLTH